MTISLPATSPLRFAPCMASWNRIGLLGLVLTVIVPARSMGHAPSVACDVFIRTREREPRLIAFWMEWSKLESDRMSMRPIPKEPPAGPWLNSYFDTVMQVEQVMAELEAFCRLRAAIRPDADSQRLYEYYVCEGADRARTLKDQLMVSFDLIKGRLRVMPKMVDAARLAIDEQVAVWPACDLPASRPVLKK